MEQKSVYHVLLHEYGRKNSYQPKNWWVVYQPSEKYEFINWDDDIPEIWKNKNVPNHQPEEECA